MYKFKAPKILQPFRCDDLIRLGKNDDGGYLVNKKDVLETKNMLTIGVGQDISFERNFIELNDCPLFAYDKNICNVPEIMNFFVDKKKHFDKNVSNKDSFDEIAFNSVIGMNQIFLKCDIEGEEYNILDDIILNSNKFTGIVMEFHDINNPNKFNLMMNFVSKVKQKIVHVHVNNYFYYKTQDSNIPDIIEITFTSSNNIIYDRQLTLPHKLDMPNNPHDEEFELIFY